MRISAPKSKPVTTRTDSIASQWRQVSSRRCEQFEKENDEILTRLLQTNSELYIYLSLSCQISKIRIEKPAKKIIRP